MARTIFSLLIAILFAVGGYSQSNTKDYAFTNGNWYTGSGFTTGNWYSVNGVLTKKSPEKVDSTIDLAGRWIVPPLADAFCSSVSENPSAGQQLKFYLDEGIFYLQTLGNTQEGRKNTESVLKKAGVPEMAFANGGFTCTLGYPFLKYEAPAQGVRNPNLIAEKYTEIKSGRKMLGDGYWFVDNKAAIGPVWKQLKEQKPDVISIYLFDAQNSGGTETKGLTPDAAKAIVKKARRSNMRVFAHVETAEDVRLGLKIGVHGFANLPGHNWDGSGDGSKYKLTDEDLQKLAKKKTVVIPLFSHAQTHQTRVKAAESQAKELKRLLDAGVNVVIGSDDPQRTIRGELNYWFQFGDLNYAKVLEILCVNTPQAIYPNRKIGRFEEGYEASFLALRDNPLENILKLRTIELMVHRGRLLGK